MKDLIYFIISLLLIFSCSKKYNEGKDYPKLTEKEALIGFQYLELKDTVYVFNSSKAREEGVSDKIINVFLRDVDGANTYLKKELGDFYNNKDSVDYYMLRLMNFQKINENNIHSDKDSIYKEIRLK